MYLTKQFDVAEGEAKGRNGYYRIATFLVTANTKDPDEWGQNAHAKITLYPMSKRGTFPPACLVELELGDAVNLNKLLDRMLSVALCDKDENDNRDTLSPEKRYDYLAGDGVRCPFCGSDQIEGGALTADGGCAWQKISCLGCDAEWDDVYALSDIAVRQIPEREAVTKCPSTLS